MNPFYKTILVSVIACSTSVIAAESGVAFEYKDWEVACDNTLTCRVAGYANEEGKGGSILLTRKAGPDTAITGEVVLIEDQSEVTPPQPKLTLWINNKSAGALKAKADDAWQLSDDQVSSVIEAVKGSGQVVFKGGPAPFVLSNDGAYAVLLKMDDAQGRIGTPGAVTKKGDKPESSVMPALPAPVIQAAVVSKDEPRPLTPTELAAIKPKLFVTLKGDDQCEKLQSPQDSGNNIEGDEPTVTPLDASHVLISSLCWRAAYNEGYGYWVTDSKMTETPVLVTVSGTDYSNGSIELAQKGRGIADCVSTASWVWDGTAFRQGNVANTGMCRYIRAGGTWDLPSYVADVKAAGGG
ncbi:DUF1176 domain-containing protein [Erwinia sp.]|uniref:DUF1176 domain-containing protein n=1 Tax=Erwinia citreus TaxID=558 RepID=UPI003C76C6F0